MEALAGALTIVMATNYKMAAMHALTMHLKASSVLLVYTRSLCHGDKAVMVAFLLIRQF